MVNAVYKFSKYAEQEVTKHCTGVWRIAWADGAYTMLRSLRRDIGEETFEIYFKALCDSSSENKTYFETMRSLDEETTELS
jgi:hypothetical protein